MTKKTIKQILKSKNQLKGKDKIIKPPSTTGGGFMIILISLN